MTKAGVKKTITDTVETGPAAPLRPAKASQGKETAVKPRLTQAERTAISDKMMFDAAIKLISERGTNRTTLKDVGELAGYSRGLANYRFGSKDKLFRKIISHFNHIWQDEVDKNIGTRKGLQAFLVGIDAVQNFLLEQPHYMKAMYILWYESIGDQTEVKKKLAEQHEAYRTDAQKWIEEGIAAGDILPTVDAKHFAIQYCSFVFGTIYQWLVNADALDIKEIFAKYRENALKLLTRP